MAYDNDLTALFNCFATTMGQETGTAIKTEINKIIALENVDVASLTAAVTAIQSLLDENDNPADGIQLGQNIIARLTDLSTRLDTIENSTALQSLTTIVNTIDQGLTAEITRALAAEAALSDRITTLNNTVETLSQTVADLVAQPTTNACDCDAITASIAAQQASIVALLASDASQNVQLTYLQETLAALQVTIATVNANANAAAAAAVAAQTTANTAVASINTLQTTVNNIGNTVSSNYSAVQESLSGKMDKSEITAINCVALGALFRAGIAAGLTA